MMAKKRAERKRKVRPCKNVFFYEDKYPPRRRRNEFIYEKKINAGLFIKI